MVGDRHRAPHAWRGLAGAQYGNLLPVIYSGLQHLCGEMKRKYGGICTLGMQAACAHQQHLAHALRATA